MVTIKVDLSHEIIDGQPITFVAPCDCTAVTGLNVCYPEGEKEFVFKDAHGHDLTGIGNLFASGAYVKAILDTKNGYAYLQNADTNAYLEAQLASKRPNTWTPTAEEVGARPNTWTPTAEEVGTIPVINYNNTGCYYRVLGGVVEWINPPFDLNEEYRTIERYKRLPVYVKAAELDLAPSGSKFIHVYAAISDVVSIDGSVWNRDSGIVNPISSYTANISMNMYGNFVWNVTENSVARIIMKFTKK